MVDTSNEIELPRQWLLRAFLVAIIIAPGCRSQSADHVYGSFSIDKDKLLEQGKLQDLRPIIRESVVAMATGLSTSVIYEFGAKSCARVVNGNREPLMCEFVRIEKKTVVVFRSQDVHGLTRYLRLTPIEGGLNFDTGTENIPLKRIMTDGS